MHLFAQVLLCCIGATVSAQSSTWVLDGSPSLFPRVLGLSNGDILLYDRDDDVIVRMAQDGSTVWAKEYGTIAGVADVFEHADGSLQVLFLKPAPGDPTRRYPAYARLDAEGVPFGQLIVLAERTVYSYTDNQLTKRPGDDFFVILSNLDTDHKTMHRIDGSGNVSWSADMAPVQWNYFRTVMGSDHYLYGIMRRTIYKFDLDGDLVWTRPYLEDGSMHQAFDAIVALPDGLAIGFRERPAGSGTPAYPVIALVDTSGNITNTVQWNMGTGGVQDYLTPVGLAALPDRLVLSAPISYFASAIFSCDLGLGSPTVDHVQIGSQSLLAHVSSVPDGGAVVTGSVSSTDYNGTLLVIRADSTLDLSDCYGPLIYPDSAIDLDPWVQWNEEFIPYVADWTGEPLLAVDVFPVGEIHCLNTGVVHHEMEEPVPLWPVPCSGRLNVNLPRERDFLLTVDDPFGRVVWRGAPPAGGSTLDLSQLADGAYVLRAWDMGRGSSRTGRFIIAR